jgi:hypothetical protein
LAVPLVEALPRDAALDALVRDFEEGVFFLRVTRRFLTFRFFFTTPARRPEYTHRFILFLGEEIIGYGTAATTSSKKGCMHLSSVELNLISGE